MKAFPILATFECMYHIYSMYIPATARNTALPQDEQVYEGHLQPNLHQVQTEHKRSLASPELKEEVIHEQYCRDE